MASELTYAAQRARARCAEVELLLHCAVADAGNGDHVVKLVQQGLDWGALSEAAEYHGPGPILCTARWMARAPNWCRNP